MQLNGSDVGLKNSDLKSGDYSPGEDESPRLLFIDDDMVILDGFRFIFEADGFIVDTAQDAETVFKLLEENRYCTIVMDYMLPGLDGREIAEKILEMDEKANLIFISGQITAEEELKRYNIPVIGFFLKPLKIEELADFIKESLGNGI